jgi:hypothetical protein
MPAETPYLNTGLLASKEVILGWTLMAAEYPKGKKIAPRTAPAGPCSGIMYCSGVFTIRG